MVVTTKLQKKIRPKKVTLITEENLLLSKLTVNKNMNSMINIDEENDDIEIRYTPAKKREKMNNSNNSLTLSGCLEEEDIVKSQPNEEEVKTQEITRKLQSLNTNDVNTSEILSK